MPEIRSKSSTGGEKGVKLARFDLLPVGPLTELAEHYGIGASKYANHQWRQGYEWSKSYSALMRHLTAFWAGQDFDVCSNDPDGCSHFDLEGKPFVAIREDACFNHTGSHHMAAVAWHAFLLLEFKDAHQGHDDRYVEPVSNALEEQAAELGRLAEGIPASDLMGSVTRWVRDYDTEIREHLGPPGDFPRVDTGLTTLADASEKFGLFPPLDTSEFKRQIDAEVLRIVRDADRRVEERLRETYGPDLLKKRRPIKDTPQA